MRDTCDREVPSSGSLVGLSVLLDEHGAHNANAAVLGCVRDKCKSDSIDTTLNYIFDVNPGHQASFSAGEEASSHKIESALEILLQELPAYNGSGRDGITITDGRAIVDIDRDSASEDLKYTQGGLVLESQAAFSSVRSNTCVSTGKWMYEVTLETAGIQQLGWATCSCNFTREEGVGDSTDSYAYDGKRVRKWSVSWHPYGQPWVPGDVIGCCIDLDKGEILFLRNGFSLGIAFTEVGRSNPKFPYYPAISLSQGERCDLNFGARPFRFPVDSFQPLQAPPLKKDSRIPILTQAQYVLGCLQRLLQLESKEVAASRAPLDFLRRLKSLGKHSNHVGKEICKHFVALLLEESDGARSLKYVTWGAVVPFLLELHRFQPPHDVTSVDIALKWILSLLDTKNAYDCIQVIMEALAYGCRTASLVLAESPFTSSYPYLALAIHLIQNQDILMQWYRSETFEVCLEGLLSKKGPNKYDLKKLMPTVWWPGSREDSCTETNMRQTSQALAKAISKIEELQWELSYCLLEAVPASGTDALPSERSKAMHPSGSIFMSFLKYLISKNKGAARNMPPPGLSDNSVLVTAYTVLLRFLSEGLPSRCLKSSFKDHESHVGFLHRGGSRCFDVQLFLDADSYATDFARVGGTFSHLLKEHILAPDDYKSVVWEESCMEEVERRVSHWGKQKPCCCPGASGSPVSGNKGSGRVLNRNFSFHVNSVSENIVTVRPDSVRRSCTGFQYEKPCSSDKSELICESTFHHYSENGSCRVYASDIQEEELLDVMVLLYHLGVAPNFKQASYYLQHQVQYVNQLDDTDRQIRTEKASGDALKRLKEARAGFREELIECVRQSTWCKVSLFSKWKQRGMFGTCMWIVQLLLMLSDRDALFSFVPEYYVESLLDCFHALRRSDPLFVSPTALLQQGLSPLITFLVTHFNDARIANSDIRDALLQSISVLVQYKEHVVAFESNSAAIEVMPGALLSAFDNRFWIPVTNILLRLCKGTGFGASKSLTHGESCSPTFQGLLRVRCMEDEKLFSSFLNRLFNTLNWTVTEFSVSMKELQEQSEQRQIGELQQRKCSIMFELSCNLERILEFFTRELPQAFLCGPEMNLIRLCELLMFVLNHTTVTADALFFESTQRHHGQYLEKINKAMILAPLVGIILNLLAAKKAIQHVQHDMAHALLNVDVSSVATQNFEYLVNFSWGTAFKGDPSLARLPSLTEFLEQLRVEASVIKQRELEDDSTTAMLDYDNGNSGRDDKEDICSICYACEINTVFYPCNHKSCSRCISRHLLNNQRCFFCNATVHELRSMSVIPTSAHGQFGESEGTDGAVGDSGLLVKIDAA
ncbi:hypothetical protein KP509_30G032900 [Ceratopteris richardii]|uniref:RING-type E3 ubiquitin transferase n=1 Tax=Ceratopteris richardii TaxID=49495 RepID=A0A8T2R3L3_CERRI|nr:hypothetical protein KP509_30G032900 [Ceratopteris richardii]